MSETHWGTCARRTGGVCDCSWPGLGDMGSGHGHPRPAVPTPPVAGQPEREALGELLARVHEHDYCHERVRQWEAEPDWEKEAHPDNDPLDDREQAEWWNFRADAILAAGYRREPEPHDERIEAWNAIASHPFFRECYATEGTLLDAMLAKLSAGPRDVQWGVQYGYGDHVGVSDVRDRASAERLLECQPLWWPGHWAPVNVVSRFCPTEWSTGSDSPTADARSQSQPLSAESDTTGATEATGATGDAQDVRGNG